MTAVPPSATAESPTETPTPSPAPPTPIATETSAPQPTAPSSVVVSPEASRCLIPVDARLATLYRRDKLGCARADASIVLSSWRPFERGALWWRKDTRNITVLPVGNPWSVQQDLWDQVTAAPSRGAPPAGPQAPDCGFGFLWGTNDRVFDQLGWSTADEQGFCALVQVFDAGILMRVGEAPTCEGQANKALLGCFPPVFVGLYGDRTWQQGS